MRRDLLSGIAMAFVGALLLFVLIPYGIVEPKKVKFEALSPSYYPRIVAVVLLLLGTVISLRAYRTLRAGGDVVQLASDQRPDAVRRISMLFVILAFYAMTVAWLGFILSSFAVLLAAFWLAGERRLSLMIPLAIGLPVGLYFFFLKVAGIPIPLGLLEPLLAGV